MKFIVKLPYQNNPEVIVEADGFTLVNGQDKGYPAVLFFKKDDSYENRFNVASFNGRTWSYIVPKEE